MSKEIENKMIKANELNLVEYFYEEDELYYLATWNHIHGWSFREIIRL